MVDMALARRVRRYIDRNPRLWDQSMWAYRVPECGTVGCFAGITVMLGDPTAEFLFDKSSNQAGLVLLPETGIRMTICERAMELLGVEYESELYGLFGTEAELEDIDEILDLLEHRDEREVEDAGTR